MRAPGGGGRDARPARALGMHGVEALPPALEQDSDQVDRDAAPRTAASTEAG